MQQMIRGLFGRTWREFLRDQRGNVLMFYGFAVIPLTFSVGMGIDYARAMKSQTKLNAAADAAALNSVSQTMMLQNTTAACQAAKALFEAQTKQVPGVTITSTTYSIKKSNGTEIGCQSITPAEDAPPVDKRYVVVSYQAQSTNYFGGILGWASLAIGGGSGTYASVAPDIDFYIALDTSPSMALPTTSAGIKTLQDNIGCTFACHSNRIEGNIQNPGTTGHMDSLIVANPDFAINYISGTTDCLVVQNPCQTANQIYKIGTSGHYIFKNKTWSSVTYSNWPNSTTNTTCKIGTLDKCVRNPDGTLADSYWYALNKGIPLRVTDERSAVKDLMDLAQTYSVENKASYRAALYTFDHSTNLKRISPLTTNLVNSGGVKTLADTVDLVTVNDKAGGGRPPNGSSGTEYWFTSFKSILDSFSTGGTYAIPNPGNGTNAPGDTPQAFVFLVTDGMSDENIGSGRTRAAMQQAQINQCIALRNRNIKVAVLYTEYTWDSVKDDEPGQRAIVEKAIKGLNGQKTIVQALTECATPGLMYTVRTDESITNALQALFSKALASARIIQ
jgi:hypothetical protein